MRYKIKANSTGMFQRIGQLLAEFGIQPAFIYAPRHLFAIEDPPGDLIRQIRQFGASITEDAQYDLDARSGR